MSEAILESSGNVFADLGFGPGEAAILHMRAQLLADLREFIRTSGMAPAEAAQHLSITPARLSDVMAGKWEKFSLEMLITLAARAGRQVTLELA